ncbi:MAG: hypothetical protein ACI8XX_001432 [Polaribacter sp.]|jgi:hypothetical protein
MFVTLAPFSAIKPLPLGELSSIMLLFKISIEKSFFQEELDEKSDIRRLITWLHKN